jgi:hypothetical protein
VRKRKVSYPPPRSKKAAPPPPGTAPEPYVHPTVVAIDLTASAGGGEFAIGDRVRVSGSGLYSGEPAVVESLPRGVVPSALVRTESGRTRRVRTIDLQRLSADS